MVAKYKSDNPAVGHCSLEKNTAALDIVPEHHLAIHAPTQITVHPPTSVTVRPPTAITNPPTPTLPPKHPLKKLQPSPKHHANPRRARKKRMLKPNQPNR